MANNTKEKNVRKDFRKCFLKKGPSEKTQWSYWMQAIEPTSEAINKAFPRYHPQWVAQSQRLTISPANFQHWRKHVLRLNIEQCAAYLRVSRYAIWKWETGLRPVPFMAFELLRVVYETAQFRLSHPAWDGWFMTQEGGLVSPDIGSLIVKPEDINSLQTSKREIAYLRAECARFKCDLEKAQVENAQLRSQFKNGEIAQELEAMQERISGLLASIHVADVIPFPLTKKEVSA